MKTQFFIPDCAARAFYDCPAIISHRPRSQNILKEPDLNPQRFKNKKTQIASKFGEIITKL